MILSVSILNIPFMKTRYLKTFPYKFKETLWSPHVICVVKKVLFLKMLSGGKMPSKLTLEVTDAKCLLLQPSWPLLQTKLSMLWFIFILTHILDILI